MGGYGEGGGVGRDHVEVREGRVAGGVIDDGDEVQWGLIAGQDVHGLVVAEKLGGGDAEHIDEYLVKMAVVGKAGGPCGVVDGMAGHDATDGVADAAPEDVFINRNPGLLAEEGAEATCREVDTGGEGGDVEFVGLAGVDHLFDEADALVRSGRGGLSGQYLENMADDAVQGDGVGIQEGLLQVVWFYVLK